jgi:predicted DCC family thiol-disulfide oxidoreductase YuxK
MRHAHTSDPLVGGPRPVLIYDGDCTFCAYWARYWHELTGDRVEYRTYQDAAPHHPAISLSDFQRAVQYVTPDGRVESAAKASFLTLSHARGKGIWLALYRRMPGFGSLAELAYAFIASHRSAFYRLSLVLWGRNYRPPQYDVVTFLFLRAFGLICLSAFVSFGVQAQGLIGSRGILPLADLVDALRAQAGSERFYYMPMVFWWSASDLAIRTVCWTGTALSLLLVFNLLPRLCLFLLYALYLSLLYGGQDFMTYQWDGFLLEAGVLSLLMSFARTPGIWLLRWLLFRFMFMSGVVKLESGDLHWWNLSALSYHFLTQPLPTPFAWYAAELPGRLLTFACGSMLVIELILPFLIFCPRGLRFIAGFGIALLQVCILITGNYNWFNFQTLLLCLLLFDDAALQRIMPASLNSFLRARGTERPPRRVTVVTAGLLTLLIVFLSLVEMDERFGGDPPRFAKALDAFIEPLHITSSYGLFAVMTTERDEIVIEGSSDGVQWREYEFRYKPGDLARRPPWNIPHQPRLDWQMWFAALEDPGRLRWFPHFLQRVLENEPTVLALLQRNPFPDKRPLYVRAAFYDYTYADRAQKAKGYWWKRRLLGLYYPAVHLKSGDG